MRTRILGLFLIMVSPLMVQSADLVVSEAASFTGASKVFLVALQDDKGFGDAVTGEVVENYPGTSMKGVSAGGQFLWRNHRTNVSGKGTRHIHFEQRYRPPAGRFNFGRLVPTDGFKIAGGYLSYHSTESVDPYLVYGAVFEDISEIRNPTVTDAKQALTAAAEAVDSKGEEEVDFSILGDPEMVAHLENSAELWLHPTATKNEFGFAWHVPVMIEGRGAVPVIVDAETSELLAISPQLNWDPACGFDTNSPELVVGVPFNQSLGTFNLIGTTRNAPVGWYCLDAHRPMDAVTPSIQVLRGQSGSWCAYQRNYIPAYAICAPGEPDPLYDNIEVQNPYGYQCYPGRSIADAMRHTKTTFDVLHSQFGREGIAGAGTPFRIVVDGRCDIGLSGYVFNDLNVNAPKDSILICGGNTGDPPNTPQPTGSCPMFEQGPSLSAALDIIGHEIGHGVIIATAGLSNESAPGDEFHEGFADVFGHGVEHVAATPGEPADWTGGEDSGQIWRRVDIDTGTLRFFYSDSQHDGSPHARGTPLPVAMRLLSIGGGNPACGGNYNQPPADTCAVSVDGVGVHTAFRIFYTLLDSYVTPSTDWADFPNLIVTATEDAVPGGEWAQPNQRWVQAPPSFCIPYGPTKYQARQSMRAIELTGGRPFCETPNPD